MIQKIINCSKQKYYIKVADNSKYITMFIFIIFLYITTGVTGNTYAPLTNSPLTNALVSAQSSIQGNTATLQTNTGTNGQQFVSYNGETYILQPRYKSFIKHPKVNF